MSRRTQRNDEAPSHDSFLDIVANIVGILIILVVVVGVRVKNLPVTASIAAADTAMEKELLRDVAEVQAVRGDVLEIDRQIKQTERVTLVERMRRDRLALAVAVAKQELDQRRQNLDADARVDFELRQDLSHAKFQLEQAQSRLASAEAIRAEPAEIENRPTALSQTVNRHEVHFQVRGGRVVRVPFEELMQRVLTDYRLKASRVFDPAELTGTVGPEDGFRVRYIVGHNHQNFEFIPVAKDLGETADEALGDGSAFRRSLSQLSSGRTSITLWAYEDSFGSFQRLKKELYRLGFHVAARPMPNGIPISASSQGSKSSAQ